MLEFTLFVVGIIFAFIAMVLANVAYDFFAAVVPIAALPVVAWGICIGLVTAVRNTVRVYKKVYTHRGGGK